MTDPDIPSAYVRDKRPPRETREQLRARIPGWGADLDPADRPSHPRLHYAPDSTGAHWDFPERQPETQPRERSIEHAFVTPVFGTAQPLRGVSGAIRRLAYRRFSEGRLAHWLLLIVATLHPDNPVTETGVRAEFTHGGLRSRRGRSDARHHLLDPVLVAGPWVAGAAVTYTGVRRLVRALRR
jgi:hypothetical protein